MTMTLNAKTTPRTPAACGATPAAVLTGANNLQQSERALDMMLTQRGDAIAEVEQILADDPESVFGHCLRAALIVRADSAAARSTLAASIAAIEAATAESDQDDDCDSWSIASDHHFHLAVARASQSAVLEDALMALLAHISGGIGFAPNVSRSLGRQARELEWREHQAIEAAIRERDEEQAYAAMRHHLESARLRLLDGSIGP